MDVIFIMNFPAYFNPEIESTGTCDEKAPGLGFEYSLQDFVKKRMTAELSKKFEALNTQLKGGSFQTIADCIITPTQVKQNEHPELVLMAFIVWSIISTIWDGCNAKLQNIKKPRIHFVLGGINSINPFHLNIVKNEYDVYGNTILMQQTPELQKSRVASFFENIKGTLSNILGRGKKIYIDMNGSMAWYAGANKKCLQANDVKGVFILGGVLTYSKVNTMSRFANLNRFSSSTMNQLYHPSRTGDFFKDFEKKLYFVPNNEINAHFSFLETNKFYPSMRTWVRDEFSKAFDAMYTYANNDTTVKALFNDFYDSRPLDRKPFDVISALALVQFIGQNSKKKFTQDHVLVYDSQFGTTLLHNKQIKKMQGAISEYKTKGMFDFDINSNKEFTGAQLEAASLLNTTHKTMVQHVGALFSPQACNIRYNHDVYINAIAEYLKNGKSTMTFTSKFPESCIIIKPVK